jgi:hypothetical protein
VLPEEEEFLVLLFFLIHRKADPAQQVLEARVGAQGVFTGSTDDMLGDVTVAECCRWRDRLVRKIRRLKEEDPLF